MADNKSRSASRINSARRSTSGAASSTKNVNLNRSASRDLFSREEEYKRLNDELEAKTANLVREAEEVMREQDSVLSRPSLLDNINTDDFLKDYGNEEDFDDDFDRKFDNDLYGEEDIPDTTRSTARDMPDSSRRPPSQPSSSRVGAAKAASRPTSKVVNKTRPQSATKKNVKPRPNSRSRTNSRAGEDVALMDDDAFMTKFSLHKTISNIEGKLEDGELLDDEVDDILPSGAADMGSEAQIRFLKAKLRVMQEELDRLAEDCNKKDVDNDKMVSKIKEIDDERNRLQRTNAAQQTQIDKYKRLSEDAKGKTESLEGQLVAARKELEGMKRSQKQQVSSQSVTEVRLNRAMEEVEKYKAQLLKAKTSSKDTVESEKRRAEQLLGENKRLEKQKNELMTGFKKQLKLIDILKRQKMHIEAAKMLSFTEEEFVKALEWGN